MNQRLPDFVIVGETKCGTTSVAHHLDEHPAVHVSRTRPVRFFDERWDRGLGWYAEQFAGAPEGSVLGDDTPNYLFEAVAIDRLVATLPAARLVVMLREPVRRAWSHHAHHVRTGFDRRSFGEAVQHELEHGPGRHGTPEGSAYVTRGHYDVTVGRLLAAAGADRVHVAFFDDLVADPRRFVAALYEFLGVDPGFTPAGIDTVYNVGWTPRSRLLNVAAFHLSRVAGAVARPLIRANVRTASDATIARDLCDRLEHHYRPHLAALRELVGDRELPAWSSAGASFD